MDIEELKLVRALARTPNLSHAAVLMNTSQPRLSQQLAKLERELGAQLFDRTSRGLHLTASGEVFSPFAAQIVSVYAEALKALVAVRTTVQQELRVGVVHTSSPSCPSRLLKQMRVRYPAMRVTVTKGTLPALLHELQEKELDAVLCYEPREYGSFEWQPLFTTRLSGFTADTSSTGHQLSLRDFAKNKLVLPSRRCEVRVLLDKEFKRLKLSPNVVTEVDDIALIRSLVREGETATILPESTLHSIKGLARIRLVEPIINLTAGVVHLPKACRPARLLLSALTEGRAL